MQGGFQNPPVGDQGTLTRVAIKSPDFVHNVSGWSINRDGTAEFQGLIVEGGTVIISGPGDGLFIYNGSPAAGNLIADAVAAGGTDGLGNATYGGFASIDPATGLVTEIFGGKVFLFSQTAGGLATVEFDPVTGGMKVPNPLAVIGSNAGQLAYIEQDGTTGHGLTVNLAVDGGTSQAAINCVSQNSAFTALEVAGVEKHNGTVKITHHGYADGSDSGAAALSIDLQTSSGGPAGTAAGGIFITSTTDNPYASNVNMIDIRLNSLDIFTVKSQGVVGIGVPVAHIPAAMLEIDQKDTATTGLYVQGIAAGQDLVSVKIAAGTAAFQVSNAGNSFHRLAAFFSTNLMIGSVSSDFGGAGSALTICHTTDPTTSPAAGHIIIYVDASGNLLARTSAGNVRTIAAV